MEDDPRDPRTAARVAAIRAGVSLPVTQVHGSLEGRAGGEVIAAAMEPDGRHAALVLRDAVERWDLDAIACVGRWEAPTPDRVERAFCVAEAPVGLRLVCAEELWRVDERGQWQSLEAPGPAALTFPFAANVVPRIRGDILRVLRLDDGGTLWQGMFYANLPDVIFSHGGRHLLQRVSATSFDVVELELTDEPSTGAGSLRPQARSHNELRIVARLTTNAPARGTYVAFGALQAEGKLVAVATRDGVVLGRWDDWSNAALLPDTTRPIARLEFIEGGRTLALCGGDYFLFVDVASSRGREVRGPVGPMQAQVSLALAAMSSRVLGIVQGCLFVVEVGSDAARIGAFDPLGRIVCAAGTLDGIALITGADDGAIRVRDRGTGEVLARAEIDQPVRAIAASADGRAVFVAGAWAKLRQYHRDTSEHIGEGANLSRLGRVGRGHLAVSAAGRHVAVAGDPDVAPRAMLVDVARDSQRLDDLGVLRDANEIQICGVAFRPASRLRLVYCTTPRHPPSEVGCAEYPLDVADGRVIARWTFRENLSDGDALRYPFGCALSRDGALLWRVWLAVDDAWRVAVAALDPPPRVGYARWALDGEPGEYCAGRALFAAATDAGSLWLLSARGDHVTVAWPGGCAPLAFAPDDRALWVRDASGLVAELRVPEALIEDSPRERA